MVDGLLGGLFGGPDSDRMRSQAQDFVGRYETGQPHEGYTNDEVMERFRQVRGQMNDDDMREAARQSFSRMSPDQRREYKRAMRQEGARGFDRDDDNDDPDILAQATQGFMKEQPNQGGGLGGMLGGLFGQDQSPQRQLQQQDQGSMMDNPAVKAAMAGMAAFAMKKMMDNR